MIDRVSGGLPAQFMPMLATAGELAADDAAWAFEMKWDGLRAIATITGGAVTLYSRKGRDVTATYPELAGLAAAVGGRDVVLDGEIVAFGGGAWPSFEALQQRMNVAAASQVRRLRQRIPVTYLAFDLLFADGRSLTGPAVHRAQDPARIDSRSTARAGRLRLLSPGSLAPTSRLSPGSTASRASWPSGLPRGTKPGRRSPSWRKIKNVQRQEFVIGGYRPGEGVRTDQIGSLIVGVYGPDGFTFAGHVGTGFTRQTLAMLMTRIGPLRRKTTPFGATIPADQARGAIWIEPQVVIEAEFALWTSAGRLRAATYRGIRDDKDPADVVRE